MKPEFRRTKVILVRLTEDEHARVQRWVEKAKARTVSDYVRELLFRKAEKP